MPPTTHLCPACGHAHPARPAIDAWLGERLTALAVDEDDVEDRQEWIVGRR